MTTTKQNYKIKKPVRLIQLFGGIGSQAMALRDLGVDFEDYVLSEWEVNCVKSYKAIHRPNDNKDYSKNKTKEQLVEILDKVGISTDGKNPMTRKQIERKGENWLRETYNNFTATRNIGSIVNRKGKDLRIVDTDKYEYILFYSFPCQDLSLAGKQKGMSRDAHSRSGLLWEVERLLKECNEIGELPQILIMENVNQVHSKKNIKDFEEWNAFLKSLGYTSFYKDLNAKDFGIVQNRVRTFEISILGEAEYTFPEPIELKYRLKDVLQDEVPEEYYINTDKARELIGTLIDKGILPTNKETYSLKNMGSSDENRIPDAEKTDVAHTVLARDWKGLNNYGSNGVIEKEQMGIDLTTNNPSIREVSNCLKAGCRGITNFAQDETGVVESV